MTSSSPTLYFICGKIASGKSTLAKKLSARPGTVLISEDEWLANLYPNGISVLEDYVRYSSYLRCLMGPHIESLLLNGVSVVMDYPANTLKTRQWMRSIFEGAGSHHELHYLDVTDAVCLMRLKERIKAEAHHFQTNETEFKLITSYFLAPEINEGFNVIVHKSS